MEGNFNRHLGSKLRMRRLALGLTQTKVAQAINVTFQQIQKYEKGTNGISSLRIMQLGNILKVPVMYFLKIILNIQDLLKIILEKKILIILFLQNYLVLFPISKKKKYCKF